MELGVNIDHVATLRQVRGTPFPDPVAAALICQAQGANSITLHLREDRRHIQERDVEQLKVCLDIPMNLEMAVTEEMLQFAEKIRPAHACFVPERRAELTTEQGLWMVRDFSVIQKACERLVNVGIRVSLFIDADFQNIDAAKACGASVIELHTGPYAEADGLFAKQEQTRLTLEKAAQYAASQGLIVHAGHGLNYTNVQAIARIPQIAALNIGHSLVARAIFTGLGSAVCEMKALINQCQSFCSEG